MGVLGILLLVGGALAGLVGMGGVEDLELDDGDLRGAGANPEQDQEDELLLGSDDGDLLQGGGGGDWILGLDGEDTLDGGIGKDVIVCGLGADIVTAGAGDDFVEAANVVDESALRQSATGSNDIFDIVFKYDLPKTSDEGDLIDLGEGDDTVVAGSSDTVTGGDGADEFALGDWIEGGKPVEIEDFDEAEDIITFVYDKSGTAPELSIERNETTGITTIKADGEAIAVLRDASPAFSVQNIAVGRYTA